jgi:ankyrin repeat protein
MTIEILAVLFRSIEKGDISEVNLLIGKNPSLIKSADSGGLTALHKAAQEGQDYIIICLLKQGAKMNVRDKRGLTPLHWAAIKDRLTTALLLRSSGADIKLKAIDGKTASGYAELFGHQAIIDALKITNPPGRPMEAKDKASLRPASRMARADSVDRARDRRRRYNLLRK